MKATSLIALGACFALAFSANSATFDVKAFGAKGDGVSDDAPAFRSALDSLRAAEAGSILKIPSGVYKLLPIPGGKPEACLVLSGLDKKSVEGDGDVTLLLGKWTCGLLLRDLKGARLKNLEIDHATPPFSQGRIIAFDKKANAIDLQIDHGYPAPDGDFLNVSGSSWCKFYEPSQRALRSDLLIAWCREAKRNADGTYRIAFKGEYAQGDQLKGLLASVMVRRKGSAVQLMSCVECELEGVHVYSSPELAFSLFACDAISLKGCSVEHKPGTNRLLSSNADGLHVKFNRRGPLVENCFFADCDDDCINIAGVYQRVWEQTAPDCVVIDYDNNAKAGDEYVFFRFDDGCSFGKARSVSMEEIEVDGVKMRKLKLDREMKIDCSAASLKEPANWRLGLATKDKFRALEKKPAFVCNLDASGRGAVIRGCRFGQHWPRGILIHGIDATIEGNVFESFLGPAIVAGSDMNWGEGPDASGLVVKNNVFRKISRSAVMVAEHGINRPTAESVNIANIRIVGNSFENYGREMSYYGRGLPGNAICLDNARNVVVEGNVFKPSPGTPLNPDVIVRTCKDVRIRGSQVYGRSQAEWLKDDEAPSGEVSLEGNVFKPLP